MANPDRDRAVAQLDGSPRRRYYTGRDLSRAVAVEDLRAITHRRMPRFVLEYLEGGAGEEATLLRERTAYADWRFTPRQLVDVTKRSLATRLLGRESAMPIVVAPTGLNGLFRHGADTALAQAAARSGVPFVQSTMSNDPMETVARVPNLRHWWQLYVFGLFSSGGLRRGTDLLKARALGAEAVFAGRAPLYGLCAGGADGAARALEILKQEALDAMGLLGATSIGELGRGFVLPTRVMPTVARSASRRDREGGAAAEGEGTERG